MKTRVMGAREHGGTQRVLKVIVDVAIEQVLVPLSWTFGAGEIVYTVLDIIGAGTSTRRSRTQYTSDGR